MPYHSIRDDSSVDVDMVRLLIKHGASPNQRVYLNDGESVWGLFLISIDSLREQAATSLKRAWFESCLVLIQAGARSDYTFVHEKFKGENVGAILRTVFGSEKVAILETQMVMGKEMQKSQSSSCQIM